ncbi:hypothetical protein K431DRAFT_324002 [Polychaeton citri CBS 116435]|uniref:Methyltransferase domain-containing protein n=1 Tax=Polychaeton citri CBS 116435 TaxID=1314669 RepID=A0A9P4Q145_9PEZI|nr:hypothetical protein K431DRAFT_324002 [Polychaeton citri CBS 116435]
MPPNFESKDYWNKRFTDNTSAFEWLTSGENLDATIQHCIEATTTKRNPNLRIFHIGCGTSDLSFQLCRYVRQASQVCNSDYSSKAIELGQARERKLVGESLPPVKYMQWKCEDLLSLRTVGEALQRGRSGHGGCRDGRAVEPYDLVLDKSTADSICCGSYIPVSLPYSFYVGAGEAKTSGSVYPLNVLAVHLAALTTPSTGRWVVLSYSDDRFPFLSLYPRTTIDGVLSDELKEAGFPDPRTLWKLESKQPVISTVPSIGGKDGIHRPELQHWLYVLARTDERVDLGTVSPFTPED